MQGLTHRLLHGLRLVLRSALLTALVLSAFRVAFVLRHAGPETRLAAPDLVRGFAMGLRFDLKVGVIAALPLFLAGALWPRGRGRWVAAGWVALAGFWITVAALVNDGYFAYFHTPIDPIVFGLFEDDTGAVFRSLWEDHHIVLGPLAALLMACAQALLVLRPPRWTPGPRVRTALLVVAPLLLAFVARGRFGGFPLNAKDFAVSTEPLLNASVPNGPVALSVAIGQRTGVVAIGDDPRAGLRKAGFADPSQAAAVLGFAPEGASDEVVREALFTRSRANPAAAARPPHVVLVVMESWGADLLRYHSEKTDLLGRLAPYMARGLVFRRFVASTAGTIGSLETLLVNTPLSPLLSSREGYTRFEQAAVLPFKAAGYRTVYGMGWSGTWRNTNRAYPVQGFDEVRDVNDVLAVVPDAPVGTWGVPDGALFTWALRRLQEADARGERLLLVLMTATNHSPHRVPPDYTVRPIDFSAFSGRVLGDRGVLPQAQTYQYACDALGGFLDALGQQGLSDRTIVAATGDHTTRGFFEYPDGRELAWRDRVPFLVVAPPAYLGGASPDLDRWAGHRDVFPTLAGLALSGARVFRAGEDLFSPPARPPRAIARWVNVLSDAGVIPDLAQPGVLCWDDGRGLTSARTDCAPGLERFAREERALEGLLDWEVRRQVIAERGRSPSRPAPAGKR